MWELMCTHHDDQLKTVTDLKSLEISGAPKETTKHHLEQTKELCNVIEVWQSQFEKLSTNQKHYIQALNSWLKLNLIPIESSLKEKISSPPRIQNPPIQVLLHSWHEHLEKLPDELAKSAIASFAAVIKTIMLHQEEEMKLKDKCEETRKELLRKSQAFDDWYQKHHRRTQNDDMEPDGGEGTVGNLKSISPEFTVGPFQSFYFLVLQGLSSSLEIKVVFKLSVSIRRGHDCVKGYLNFGK